MYSGYNTPQTEQTHRLALARIKLDKLVARHASHIRGGESALVEALNTTARPDGLAVRAWGDLLLAVAEVHIAELQEYRKMVSHIHENPVPSAACPR